MLFTFETPHQVSLTSSHLNYEQFALAGEILHTLALLFHFSVGSVTGLEPDMVHQQPKIYLVLREHNPCLDPLCLSVDLFSFLLLVPSTQKQRLYQDVPHLQNQNGKSGGWDLILTLLQF